VGSKVGNQRLGVTGTWLDRALSLALPPFAGGREQGAGSADAAAYSSSPCIH
jgi:hypothetical protein